MTSSWRPVRLALLLFAALLLALPSRARAQAAECDERLQQAEQSYQQQQFGETVSLLAECANRPAASTAYAVQAYRLMTLAFIQEGDLNEAKLTALELLSRAPGYVPDPVQDPPAYVSVVNIVRQQMALPATVAQLPALPPAEAPSEVPSAELPADARTETPEDGPTEARARGPAEIPAEMSSGAKRALLLTARGGLHSYRGDRTNPDQDGLRGFRQTAGPGFMLALEYQAAPRFVTGLYYLAGRYEQLLRPKGAPPDFQPIERATSSMWLQMAGLSGRVYLLPGRRISPYAQLGLNVSFSLLNGQIRAAVGPRFTAGLDVTLTDAVTLFAETDGLLTVPGDAMDLASGTSDADFFAHAGLGLRVRLHAFR